jgi:polysaccharide export outer membrane protein
MKRSLLPLMALALVGGCSTLPGDGPSGRAVVNGSAGPQQAGDYALVDLDYTVGEVIKAVPPRFSGSLAAGGADTPVDVLGIGDTLAVSIYEPSGALFGTRNMSRDVQTGTQALPPLVVDRSGAVNVPFAGRVHVEGLTGPGAADAIKRALRGKVGNPQVVAYIAQNPSNAITVLGDVRSPGRAALSVNTDRILDVIAAVGGPTRPAEDLMVNVRRGDQTYSAPLTLVATEFGENVRLRRGDQVSLTYKPRRFTAFGAVGAVSEQDLGQGALSLTAALARLRGLDTQSANPRSVMVFRFERPEVAQALGLTQAETPKGVPVVYRLNMAEGQGFFIANNFMIQPDDVVYAPRSDSAEARKFFEFVQSITRVIYDVSVTSALNVN